MIRLLNKLRRSPEQKTSRIARLVQLESGGRARWTPRDYAALAREGFMHNAVVHRAVKLVAENVAAAPLLVYEETEPRDRHPLTDLLARPNPRQDGAGFLEAVTAHLLIAGNSYAEAVMLGGQVRELYALRPDRMRVVPGPDGWAEAYEYTVAGRTVRFEQSAAPPPILHLALFNPLDDHYGLAPLEAAAVAIDTHNAAAGWNKALLDNSARPSGALVYAGPDGAVLSDAQYERLKRELEGVYQGAANAGRPLLLEGGLEWKAMSLSPKDMDFLEAKHAAAREIALAFGVPPMLLGIPGDNTYSNYQEANRALWRQTVLPLAARIASALAQWLAPAFGEGLQLAIDTDRIEALSGDRAALWERIGRADFLTVDEKRALVGFGPVEGGDGVGAPGARKFRPDQPRDELGRWTDAGGGSGGNRLQGERIRLPDAGDAINPGVVSDAPSIAVTGASSDSGSAGETPADIPPSAEISRNIQEAEAHKSDYLWFYLQVHNRGPWDYKQFGNEYADFGNFNYGAAGTAAGFSEATLLRTAGWAQVRAGTSRPEWGEPVTLPEALLGIGGTAPFGDDPKDQFWIKEGIKYYIRHRSRR